MSSAVWNAGHASLDRNLTWKTSAKKCVSAKLHEEGFRIILPLLVNVLPAVIRVTELSVGGIKPNASLRRRYQSFWERVNVKRWPRYGSGTLCVDGQNMACGYLFDNHRAEGRCTGYHTCRSCPWLGNSSSGVDVARCSHSPVVPVLFAFSVLQQSQ